MCIRLKHFYRFLFCFYLLFSIFDFLFYQLYATNDKENDNKLIGFVGIFVFLYLFYEMNFYDKNKMLIKNSVLNKNINEYDKRIDRENLKIYFAKYKKH